jgi:hypothetical protein
MSRLASAWRQLGPEQRLAAVAAAALLLTMFLPWYQQHAVDRAGLVNQDLDAFAVFSFFEATILLVALGVLWLLFVRAEGRVALLPDGDATIVLWSGAWAALVLLFRLFDKPGVESHRIAADVGVQWGIFFALAAAGLLTYAGLRMRAARPLPPLIASARARAADRAWSGPSAAGGETWQSQQTAPSQGEGTVLVASTSERPMDRSTRAQSSTQTRSRLRRRSQTEVARSKAQQLSFEDDAQIVPEEPPVEPV